MKCGQPCAFCHETHPAPGLVLIKHESLVAIRFRQLHRLVSLRIEQRERNFILTVDAPTSNGSASRIYQFEAVRPHRRRHWLMRPSIGNDSVGCYIAEYTAYKSQCAC